MIVLFIQLPVWAVFTTSVWGKSSTFIPLMVRMMSPTSSLLVSAGVLGSMAEITTGREPWIRNPNSPLTRRTRTVLLHSEWQICKIKTHKSAKGKIKHLTKCFFKDSVVHHSTRLSMDHSVGNSLIFFLKLSLTLSRFYRSRPNKRTWCWF